MRDIMVDAINTKQSCCFIVYRKLEREIGTRILMFVVFYYLSRIVHVNTSSGNLI